MLLVRLYGRARLVPLCWHPPQRIKLLPRARKFDPLFRGNFSTLDSEHVTLDDGLELIFQLRCRWHRRQTLFVCRQEAHELHHALDGDRAGIEESSRHQLIDLDRQYPRFLKVGGHAQLIEPSNLPGCDVRRRDHGAAAAQCGHREYSGFRAAKNAEIRIEAIDKARYQRHIVVGILQPDEIGAALGDCLEGFGCDRHRGPSRNEIDEERQLGSPCNVGEERMRPRCGSRT